MTTSSKRALIALLAAALFAAAAAPAGAEAKPKLQPLCQTGTPACGG